MAAYVYFSLGSLDSYDLDILLKCILVQLASGSRSLAHLDILKQEGERKVLNRHGMFKALLEVVSSISSESAPEMDHICQAVPVVLVFEALDEVPFGAQ